MNRRSTMAVVAVALCLVSAVVAMAGPRADGRTPNAAAADRRTGLQVIGPVGRAVQEEPTSKPTLVPVATATAAPSASPVTKPTPAAATTPSPTPLFLSATPKVGAPPPAPTPPPTLTPPPLPLSAYAGTERNDFFGSIEIVEQGGGLAIVQGPKRMDFPMRHYDRDVFIYQPVGESAGGLSGVTFTIGPDQRATSVVVENLNIHDLGTFTRVTPSR